MLLSSRMMTIILFLFYGGNDMLNKHTQIALCLTTTLTITNTYSSEYIIKNASDENKEQIYENKLFRLYKVKAQ